MADDYYKSVDEFFKDISSIETTCKLLPSILDEIDVDKFSYKPNPMKKVRGNVRKDEVATTVGTGTSSEIPNNEEDQKKVLSEDVLFPVQFSCTTFKVSRGEILEGIVHEILKHGVFLRSGSIENIYLSNQKMPNYRYVPEENAFMNDKSLKIEKGSVVRCIVMGEKCMEATKEIYAIVSLEGDNLGPI